MRKIQLICILFIAAVLICSSLGISSFSQNRAEAASQSIRYTYWFIPEDGTVTQVKRPVIRFGVEGRGGKITKVSMQLDGKKVPVECDETEKSLTLTYQPAADLSVGVHSINVEFTFEGYLPVTHTSYFFIAKNQVDPYADKDLAFLAKIEEEGLAVLNQFRSNLGIPLLSPEPFLSKAAQAHSNYLLKRDTGHQEIPNTIGFTGVTPQERARFFGYTGLVGEGISYGDSFAYLGIDALMDAPYHRLGHLDPNYCEAGIGFNSAGTTVVNYGTRAVVNFDDRVVLYPFPGQKDVKIGWFVAETPNPLTSYGKSEIYVGYPISMSVHDDGTKELRTLSASLKDAKGNKIPFYLVDSTRETTRKKHVFLIPHRPLVMGMDYYVEINAQRIMQDGSVQQVQRKWSFRTQEKPSIAYIGMIKLNGEEYVDVIMKNGEIDDLTYTLKKEGVIYQTFNREGKHYYRRYRPIGNGRYEIEIKSSHFPQKMTVPIVITGTPGNHSVEYIRIKIDGKTLDFDVLPTILQGRTLVPLRAIFEKLGIGLQWDSKTMTVTGIKEGIEITLPIDRRYALVNDHRVELDVPAMIVSGRTLVPVRFIAESTGAEVAWDSVNQVVNIKMP